MLITPLQKLLRDKVVAPRQVREFTGRDRSTVYRWTTGESFPERLDCERLIELFGADVLDFNGCYVATVDVEHGHD